MFSVAMSFYRKGSREFTQQWLRIKTHHQSWRKLSSWLLDFLKLCAHILHLAQRLLIVKEPSFILITNLFWLRIVLRFMWIFRSLEGFSYSVCNCIASTGLAVESQEQECMLSTLKHSSTLSSWGDKSINSRLPSKCWRNGPNDGKYLPCKPCSSFLWTCTVPALCPSRGPARVMNSSISSGPAGHACSGLSAPAFQRLMNGC